MPETHRAAINNAAYASASLYLDYAVTLITSMIVARRLGPEPYGTYTLLMWLGTVGVVFANHGITTGVMKFVGEARGQGTPGLAGSVLLHFQRMQLWSTLAICAVLGATTILLADRIVVDPAGRGLLWVVLPSVALRSLYVFFVSAAKGFEDFRLTARVHAIVAPLSLVIIVVAAVRGSTVRDFILANLLSSVLYAGAMWIGLSRSTAQARIGIRASIPGARIQRHLVFASAIVILELVVLKQTQVLFLDRFSTAKNIAYYGIGQSLSMSAMLLVPGVMTGLLLPMMSRTFGADPALLAGRFLATTRYILILAVPVVMACELFAADIIHLLYGADYAPAVLVFRVAVAAAAVGVVSASASSYQLGTDRQSAIVAIMVAVSLVTLILDFILIRAFELRGAIAAGATGSILLGLGLLWHARNSLRIELDYSTYMRVIVAGLLSMIPAIIIRATTPVWVALPVGTIMLSVAYAALTIPLGAWTPSDVHALRAFTDRMPPTLGRAIATFIQRAANATSLAPRDA